MVASRIILFTITFMFGLPNSSNSQIVSPSKPSISMPCQEGPSKVSRGLEAVMPLADFREVG